MAAGRRNIIIEKGATFQFNLLWKDANDVAINLTGYTARMQVRKTVNSTDTLLDMTTENSGIALGGVAGTIAVTATATATAAISEAAKTGVYDLELVSGAGVVKRLVEGDVTIKPEVTR